MILLSMFFFPRKRGVSPKKTQSLPCLQERKSGRDIPGTSRTQTSGYPGQKLYASGLFCCFRRRVAGMSQDLGWDVPDLEKRLSARKLWAVLGGSSFTYSWSFFAYS